MTFIEEHYRYLADPVRMSAYDRAIREVVRPGDVVLDLGAGTGILGLLACRAGARHVYAVEESEIIDLARDICRANHYADRVTFIRERSTEAKLPEPVDVVVTEQIGRFGIEVGDLAECLSDARERFLQPGGRLIPAQVDLYVAPVQCPAVAQQIAFWGERPAGFDFGPAHALAENNFYPTRFEPEDILSEPIRVASLDFSAPLRSHYRTERLAVATRSGSLDGLGGWFSADLAPGVKLSNSPLEPDSMKRNNLFLPLSPPVSIAPGDRINLATRLVPGVATIHWRADVRSGGEGAVHKARYEHSTFKGMLLTPEDLARTRAQSLPAPKPRAKALASVLGLCSGRRALAEIEAEILRLYPDLFRSPRDAARFVAEVIRRHAR